ncbi:hypothetical protein ACSSS7_008275 [Eimeria intestinalis]
MVWGTRWFQTPLLVACLVHLNSSTRSWTALAAPPALKNAEGSSMSSASAFGFSLATPEEELSEVPSSYSFIQEQNTNDGNSSEEPKKKTTWLSKLKLGAKKKGESAPSDASLDSQGDSAGASDLPSSSHGDSHSTKKKKSAKLSLKGIFPKKIKSNDEQASSDDGDSSSQADLGSHSEAQSNNGRRKGKKPGKKSRLASFFKRSKNSAEESDGEQRGGAFEGAPDGASKRKKKGVLRRIFPKDGSGGRRNSNRSSEPLLSRSPKLLADFSPEEASAIPLIIGLPKSRQPLLPAEYPSGCMPVQVTQGFEEFVDLLPPMGAGCRPPPETKF